MKRTVAGLLGLGLWALPASGLRAQDAGSAALDARIVSIEGEVTIFYHDQGGEGVPAAEGMPLEAGDQVKTGAESRAELGIDAESSVELGPDTDFAVASVERRSAAFDLGLGSLLAKLRSGLFGEGGTLEVRTPTAVAAVRGTEFAVENAGEAGSHIGVFDEGKVAVRSPGAAQEVLLEHNQETSVLRGRAPSQARSLRRFLAQRRRLILLRRRAAGLRRRWKSLPGPRRAALRRDMFQRRRQLMLKLHERHKEMKEKRRQLRREYPRKRRP